MTNNEINALIKFLSLYNADKEYIVAVEKKNGEDWKKYLKDVDANLAISGSIIWTECRRREGEKNWYDLDEKWHKLLKGKVFIEPKESIILFNREYEVVEDYRGYFLFNLSTGENDSCFEDAGISKDKYINDKYASDNCGRFPFQNTLKDLQQIIYDMLGIKYNGYEELNHLYNHPVIEDNKMYPYTEEDCTKSKKIFTLYKPTIKNYYL